MLTVGVLLRFSGRTQCFVKGECVRCFTSNVAGVVVLVGYCAEVYIVLTYKPVKSVVEVSRYKFAVFCNGGNVACLVVGIFGIIFANAVYAKPNAVYAIGCMVTVFGVVNVFGQVFSKTYVACTTNAVVAKGLLYIERQCNLCIAFVRRLVRFVSIL